MLAMHEIQALSENFTSLKWFEHKNCFLKRYDETKFVKFAFMYIRGE